MLVTAAAAVLAYRGVQGALEREFEQRLERIALRAASQISPADVADPRARSSTSGAYTALQMLIGPLPATADLFDASILDARRVTLVDALAREEEVGQMSALDSLTRATLDAGFAGRAAVSPPYLREHAERRAAVAPIRADSGGVVGVVVIEAQATYLAALADLRQRLTMIALVSLLAIAVLAALFVRGASSTAQLERRLSRAENLAAMGRLTATLAHEIKNPLAIIRGSAERLGKLEPEAQRMAEFVIEETDRLSRTPWIATSSSRAASGGGGTGDALATLEQTLSLLEGEFQARRVTLERWHELGRGGGHGGERERRARQRVPETGLPEPDAERDRGDARGRAASDFRARARQRDRGHADGQRHGNSRGRSRAHRGSVLHHQGARLGSGAVPHAAAGAVGGRGARDSQRGRPGHDLRDALAAPERIGHDVRVLVVDDEIRTPS